MKVCHYLDIPGSPVEMVGTTGVVARVPIGEGDGAPTFTMRVFTIDPGGNTPYHRHDYEHEIFVLKGRGFLLSDGGGKRAVRPGDTILVEPDEFHGFLADSAMGLEIICLVPNRAYIPGCYTVEAGQWGGAGQ
jgi:quercetin dioxygenase-like cupin family protein